MNAAEKPDALIAFTFCPNFATAVPKSSTWEKFAATVSKSEPFESKEQSIKRSAIIGGPLSDRKKGRAENVKTRTILTLDYDDFPAGTNLDEIEFALEMALGCSFVAYSTFRHTPEAPRVRVMAPLSREVNAVEYDMIVNAMAATIGLDGLDNCSSVINQIMFLASHSIGVDPWSMIGGAGVLDVDDLGIDYGGIAAPLDEPDVFDLDLAVASQPLDITADQVAILLDSYPASALDYDGWVRVGMAIYHQTEGEGYDQWVAWSEKSPKHDDRHMSVKWRSFDGVANPVTMASIIKAVGGLRGDAVAEGAGAVAQTLEQEAEGIDSREGYNDFKARVQALNDVQMPPDIRGMLAAIVHEVYAKEAKMGLREVKAAFKHKRGSGASPGEAAKCPEWLDGWVYGEADCLFIDTKLAEYGIRREAFRAKFDRMPEVVGAETDAATFALNMVQIPTVIRSMYWPGQDAMFSVDGADFINSYHPSGIDAVDELDEVGEKTIDLFLKHVENTIAEQAEREILLDFMAYVYRNPGKRVQWGLLLWGIEGNGKTYFYNVMQNLLGRNARTITTSMIERPFNDWAVGSRLIGIEEIRISGTNKWRVLDQLKPMISNETIAIEPKGATSYHAPNFASYLMTTNHQDAVPMSGNDRRYCVIFTRQASQEDLFEQHGGADGAAEYFSELFTMSIAHVGAIGRYLLDREISDSFHPNGRAPITQGIERMKVANISDEHMRLMDAIEDHGCDIIGDRLLDVTHLKNMVMADGGDDLPYGRVLGAVLRDMGYSPVDSRRVKVKRAHHYVWYKQGTGRDDSWAKRTVQKWHSGEDDFVDVPFS